jgi:putative acetyltransferase
MTDAGRSRCDVRQAAVEDSHAVHAVRRRAIRESAAGRHDLDAIEAWASGGSEDELRRKIESTAAFVAVEGEQVVGWGNLDGAEVDQLYVDPNHGGVGVARRLYETIEDLARAQGAPRLTAVASLRAVPVFRRFGFTEVRREDRFYNGHKYQSRGHAQTAPPDGRRSAA